MIAYCLFESARRRASGSGGGGDPAGAPYSLSTYDYNGDASYGISWIVSDVAASTELYRDGVLYATLSPTISNKDVGLKASDGTHTWKARHNNGGVYSDFSAEITTENGIVPSVPTAPSSLSAYDFAAGSKFGIQWVINSGGSVHELFRDGSLYSTATAGQSQVDVGLKSGDGTHTWKARALRSGIYSGFSSEITTVNGVQS